MSKQRMRELLARTREIRARAKVCQLQGGTLKIVIHGGIDEATEASVRAWLAANPSAKEIELTIDSHGGDLNSAHRIFDVLRGSGKQITTIAAGMCYSAGTVVLLAGDHRKASRNARLLLHAPEAILLREDKSRLTADNLRKKVAGLDLSTQRLARLYASRTRRDKQFFLTEMQTEKEMSLNDALACGLVTEVEGVTEWRGGTPRAWPEDLVATETERQAVHAYKRRQAEMRGQIMRQMGSGRFGSRRPLIWC